jgi:carboxymethylenebutenolidase
MHSAEGYAADGVLFEPTGKEPFSAILMIPDERGLIKRLFDAAESLSAAGFVVVAVDLNRGEPAAVAQHSDEQAVHDLNAAFAFLSNQSNVRHDCVGAIGWGTGGAYALKLAADSRVCAVAIQDVALPKDSKSLGIPHAAVLGSFGGRDEAMSQLAVKSLEKRLSAIGEAADLKIYPEASSGFDDPEDKTHFRQSDSDDVRRRTERFFRAQLGK